MIKQTAHGVEWREPHSEQDAVQTLLNTRPTPLEAEIEAAIIREVFQAGGNIANSRKAARRILKIERIAKALRYMEEHEKVFSRYIGMQSSDAR